jgi:DNA-binding HxlR family transcriptional regulator
MKSGKVTSGSEQAGKRWYDDACGTALAMELVGERWSLLLVRELMFGPRRFAELRRGLPGISAGVLTQRLEGLEQSGILRRRVLAMPAGVQVYELTDWGRESERAIQELGRWAVRSPRHDVTLPLSPASLMMSFRTMYAGGGRGTVGFRIGQDVFRATLGAEPGWGIAVERADPAGADLVFACEDARQLAAAVYGGVPFAAAGVEVAGDHAAAARFVRLFPLPDKVAI